MISKSLILIRSWVCGLIAMFLLRTRKARIASERALSGEVITAIFFHNPSKKLFTACISWLVRNGYTPITTEELAEILYNKRQFSKGAVWLSLDDGYREWLGELLPVIREYKVPVTLFIPSGIVEGEGTFPWVRSRGRGSLTVDELKEISRYSEISIGGHTVNHKVTMRCAEEDLRFEIGASKDSLELWTGKKVCSFAYPEGRYDGRESRVLQEFKYTIAATTRPTFVAKDTDPLQVPRFCVSDKITLSEAICNMLGIWQPFLQPIKAFLAPAHMAQSPVALSTEPAPEKQSAKIIDKEEPTHVV